MNGAEDMIVDHNMVVTQVFRRLGKRLDRPCIAAKFDLRIDHTSFHRPLSLSQCEVLRRYRPLASGPEAAARIRAHNFSLDTVADYPARDDDRELQTEQPIVGLLARKLQLDRMNARLAVPWRRALRGTRSRERGRLGLAQSTALRLFA